jgi:hypothetical protein
MKGMHEMLSNVFKKKENKPNPYSDLKDDILEQTGGSAMTKSEREEFAINMDNDSGVTEDDKKNLESLNFWFY